VKSFTRWLDERLPDFSARDTKSHPLAIPAAEDCSHRCGGCCIIDCKRRGVRESAGTQPESRWKRQRGSSKWIESCETTMKYDVLINGARHALRSPRQAIKRRG